MTIKIVANFASILILDSLSMTILSKTLYSSLSLLLMTSCIFEGENNCEGEFYGNVTVVNDWKNDPDANPEGMAYFFFPVNGTEPWRFDIPGKDGGKIKIPSGQYHLITINDDSSVVIEDNSDSYERMTLHTFQTALYPGCQNPDDYPDAIKNLRQEVTICPDYIWAFHNPEVRVEADIKNETIITAPVPITATYHLIVRNVVNLEGAVGFYGAMSGMIGTIRLFDNSMSEQPVIHPFHIEKDTGNVLKGELTTFGKTPDSSTPALLFIFARLTDGKIYMYQADVTRQITEAPDRMDVWIIIDNITLPIPDDQSGAFDVSVDGWTNILINIKS